MGYFEDMKEKAANAREKLPELRAAAIEKSQELAQTAKEKWPELLDVTKEKLPEWRESAKEKLPELIESAKEKLPDILTGNNANQVYSGMDDLPLGTADNSITEGCLLLEGGAFRGLYTMGVCDALMEAGINFRTTAGVSAGAMTSVGYLSGQIGWCVRINLKNRHSSSYIGLDAMKNDHGITGFTYLFNEAMDEEIPFDRERFYDPSRRLIAQATNLLTGQPEYFEKGKCEDIFRGIQASATVPYVSEPVMIDGIPYLDGGMSDNIPYHWAKREKFKKMVVVKTRDRSYRADSEAHPGLDRIIFRDYPAIRKNMEYNSVTYNCLLDEIDADEAAGTTFVIAPKDPVDVGRFEGDLEKLGELYWKGYNETKEIIPELKKYLGTRETNSELRVNKNAWSRNSNRKCWKTRRNKVIV